MRSVEDGLLEGETTSNADILRERQVLLHDCLAHEQKKGTPTICGHVCLVGCSRDKTQDRD